MKPRFELYLDSLLEKVTRQKTSNGGGSYYSWLKPNAQHLKTPI